MAMNRQYLQLLKASIDHVRVGRGQQRLQALALGYPDLVATQEEILGVFTSLPKDALVVRPDSYEIAKRHGVEKSYRQIFDSDMILKALGLDTDYIDIAPSRGIEIKVDLNEPLPESLISKYDFVIDTGTLEHCFNVGQAFKNVSQSVRINGVIIQASPLNRYNHGFWNFCPTAYHDYYHDNGFQILYLKGWSGGVLGDAFVFDINPVGRFVPRENSALLCVCQKIEERPHQWPMQWKYRGQGRRPPGN
jgi:hypothetical protein